ncbi:hypothetical protein ACSBR1_036997 [Camellia fascicularis]
MIYGFLHLEIFSSKVRNRVGCQVHWVKDVIHHNLASWDKGKLLGLVSQEEVNQISVIPISSEGQDDSLIWHYTSKGTYDVKSGYQVVNKQIQAASNSASSST